MIRQDERSSLDLMCRTSILLDFHAQLAHFSHITPLSSTFCTLAGSFTIKWAHSCHYRIEFQDSTPISHTYELLSLVFNLSAKDNACMVNISFVYLINCPIAQSNSLLSTETMDKQDSSIRCKCFRLCPAK